MNTLIPQSDLDMLYQFFNHVCPLSIEDFNQMVPYLKKREYKKGDIILEGGQIARTSNLVLQGVVHQFVYDDDLPMTTNLTPQGLVFNSLKSYIEESPSLEIHEAITDVVLLTLNKCDLEELVQQNQAICYLMFKTHEAILLDRENRMFLLQYRSPAKRFRLFYETVARSNWLLDDTPDKYLASYLNMTPQQYSKEKKLYLKNK